MKSPILRHLTNSTVTNYFNKGKADIGRPSAKQLICLECDWPVSKCKHERCRRYLSELEKLKEN